MRRRERIIKGNIEPEKKEQEIESQWSLKRIAIFTSIVGILIFAIFYYFQLKSGDILGEQDENRDKNGPQIEIPSKDDVDDILEETEENISNINPNDIVSSQPQIQKAIEQLEKLTNKDNYKETFCSTVCAQ